MGQNPTNQSQFCCNKSHFTAAGLKNKVSVKPRFHKTDKEMLYSEISVQNETHNTLPDIVYTTGNHNKPYPLAHGQN
jgi:hypothetical protein